MTEEERRRRIEEAKRLLDEDDELRPTMLDLALWIVVAALAIIVLYTLAVML